MKQVLEKKWLPAQPQAPRKQQALTALLLSKTLLQMEPLKIWFLHPTSCFRLKKHLKKRSPLKANEQTPQQSEDGA